MPSFLARLCDLLLSVFDFFRVKALAILFHEMIASSTAYFRLLELEYSSVTGFYLAFHHLLGRSADIRTLDGGVTFLLTEVAYPRAFCTEVQFSHSQSRFTCRVPWLAVSPPFNYVKTCSV